MSEEKIITCAEQLKNMGIKELLTFYEAMAASNLARESGGNHLWPTLSATDLYAFANAAAHIFKEKEKP